MISLSLKNIIIAIVVLAIIYFVINKNEKNPHNHILPNQEYKPSVVSKTDNFWTNILQVENESTTIYQYQLPNYFNLNPKYLMYHPNFTVSANKTIQIISEREEEAVAMLNLWVALNKGLLDGEENFSKLFETSIRRAITYPSVAHKFKIEINNMIHFQPDEVKPENLEFTEDLATSEVLAENPPLREEKQFDSLNSFDTNMAQV